MKVCNVLLLLLGARTMRHRTNDVREVDSEQNSKQLILTRPSLGKLLRTISYHTSADLETDLDTSNYDPSRGLEAEFDDLQ